MAMKIEGEMARVECELCGATDTVNTNVVIDATAIMNARGWEERRAGFWFCGECIATAKRLTKPVA